MSVAISVPAYNAERFLSRTIDSVLSQRYQDWELVIVDDGSRDGTAAIARSYEQRDTRIKVICQANAGRSVARNRGYQESSPTSEFVMFLDADDELPEDALEILVGTANNDPRAVGAHGNVCRIDADSHPMPWAPSFRHQRFWMDGVVPVGTTDADPTTFQILNNQCVIYSPGCAVVRRAALVSVGLFDPELDGAEDWDLWIRVTRLGHMAYVPKPVLRYRKHSDNTSDNGFLLLHKQGYVIWKSLISSRNDPAQRQSLIVAAANHWAHFLERSELLQFENILHQKLERRKIR